MAMALRIKERRESLKRKHHGSYTQQYVADRLGMSRVGYAHYEVGRNSVSHQDIVKLAEILDVPVNYFFGVEEEEEIMHNKSIQKYELLPPRAKRMIDDQIESVYSMLLEKEKDPDR